MSSEMSGAELRNRLESAIWVDRENQQTLHVDVARAAKPGEVLTPLFTKPFDLKVPGSMTVIEAQRLMVDAIQQLITKFG